MELFIDRRVSRLVSRLHKSISTIKTLISTALINTM